MREAMVASNLPREDEKDEKRPVPRMGEEPHRQKLMDEMKETWGFSLGQCASIMMVVASTLRVCFVHAGDDVGEFLETHIASSDVRVVRRIEQRTCEDIIRNEIHMLGEGPYVRLVMVGRGRGCMLDEQQWRGLSLPQVQSIRPWTFSVAFRSATDSGKDVRPWTAAEYTQKQQQKQQRKIRDVYYYDDEHDEERGELGIDVNIPTSFVTRGDDMLQIRMLRFAQKRRNDLPLLHWPYRWRETNKKRTFRVVGIDTQWVYIDDPLEKRIARNDFWRKAFPCDVSTTDADVVVVYVTHDTRESDLHAAYDACKQAVIVVTTASSAGGMELAKAV